MSGFSGTGCSPNHAKNLDSTSAPVEPAGPLNIYQSSLSEPSHFTDPCDEEPEKIDRRAKRAKRTWVHSRMPLCCFHVVKCTSQYIPLQQHNAIPVFDTWFNTNLRKAFLLSSIEFGHSLCVLVCHADSHSDYDAPLIFSFVFENESVSWFKSIRGGVCLIVLCTSVCKIC